MGEIKLIGIARLYFKILEHIDKNNDKEDFKARFSPYLLVKLIKTNQEIANYIVEFTSDKDRETLDEILAGLGKLLEKYENIIKKSDEKSENKKLGLSDELVSTVEALVINREEQQLVSRIFHGDFSAASSPKKIIALLRSVDGDETSLADNLNENIELEDVWDSTEEARNVEEEDPEENFAQSHSSLPPLPAHNIDVEIGLFLSRLPRKISSQKGFMGKGEGASCYNRTKREVVVDPVTQQRNTKIKFCLGRIIVDKFDVIKKEEFFEKQDKEFLELKKRLLTNLGIAEEDNCIEVMILKVEYYLKNIQGIILTIDKFKDRLCSNFSNSHYLEAINKLNQFLEYIKYAQEETENYFLIIEETLSKIAIIPKDKENDLKNKITKLTTTIPTVKEEFNSLIKDSANAASEYLNIANENSKNKRNEAKIRRRERNIIVEFERVKEKEGIEFRSEAAVIFSELFKKVGSILPTDAHQEEQEDSLEETKETSNEEDKDNSEISAEDENQNQVDFYYETCRQKLELIISQDATSCIIILEDKWIIIPYDQEKSLLFLLDEKGNNYTISFQ